MTRNYDSMAKGPEPFVYGGKTWRVRVLAAREYFKFLDLQARGLTAVRRTRSLNAEARYKLSVEYLVGTDAMKHAEIYGSGSKVTRDMKGLLDRDAHDVSARAELALLVMDGLPTITDQIIADIWSDQMPELDDEDDEGDEAADPLSDGPDSNG